jgi:cellulose synthase/poly-beta-1,6-N-acetylglucosamine synthase-like glycosyltransferase
LKGPISNLCKRLAAWLATSPRGNSVDARNVDSHDIGAHNADAHAVDDRSDDGTSERVRSLGLENLVLLRREIFDHPTLTARQVALDRGIRAARGEWILLTDADALVRPDWAARMLRDPQADAVAGPVVFAPHPEGGRLSVALLQTVDSAFYTGVCSLLNAFGFASGFVFGNCAFRRSAYLKTGGFESIGFALTEDLAFARALRNADCRVAFTAYPGITVRACRTWSDLVKRARRISAGGVSVLSIVLGIWMLAWIGLGVGGLLDPNRFLIPFVVRHLLGAIFTATWLARGGRLPLIPLALLYEPTAILVGLAVLWNGRSTQKVEWGGVDYTP